MNYELILQQIKEWAKSLLIIQYSQSIKNQQLIDTLVDLIFADNLILKIRDLCLNVEESQGVQLDIVGKWVGVDRFYSGQLFSEDRFSLINYPNFENIDTDHLPAQGGFSNYENFYTKKGGFLTYEEWFNNIGTVSTLADNDYRKLIKLKIIKNSINCTMKDIDDAIYQWSNGIVYTTWEPMKLIYHCDAKYLNLLYIASTKNILLTPTGCEILLQGYTTNG